MESLVEENMTSGRENDIGGASYTGRGLSTDAVRDERVKEILEGLHLISDPPSGGYKILNIWRNAAGNLEYEYEDTPEP